MESEQNVVEFYVLCNKLKNVIRSGWKLWNVERERVESVAEHVYGAQMLAIAMWSEFKYDIDLKKVLFMLAVHELEEIVIGDLTPFEINRETKQQRGHSAVEKILENLTTKQEIQNLIFEFDNRKTKEAVFAYQCDKLEADLQCKLYDEENCVNLMAQENNIALEEANVKKLLKEENNSWSRMWLRFGQQFSFYDDNFMKVSKYAMNNKINKSKLYNHKGQGGDAFAARSI